MRHFQKVKPSDPKEPSEPRPMPNGRRTSMFRSASARRRCRGGDRNRCSGMARGAESFGVKPEAQVPEDPEVNPYVSTS